MGVAARFRGEAGTDGALRIEIRFISADSGLVLDLEIAASGDLSAGPVLRVYFSQRGDSLKRRVT